MGQTLTHGIYLPDEGERNCYSGLAANWQILDTSVGTIAEHTSALAGKAPLVHTHSKTDITDLFNSANTWSGDQTVTASYCVKSTTWEKGVEPSSSSHINIYFVDKNNLPVGTIRRRIANGSQSFQCFGSAFVKNGQLDPTGDNVTWGFSQVFLSNGSTYFQFDGNIGNSIIPRSNNTYNLGISTNKWKTLNGINPGALSLPDVTDGDPISTVGWSLTGARNTYTPTENGWFFIRVKGTASARCSLNIHSGSYNDNYPTWVSFNDPAISLSTSLVVPAQKSVNLYVYIIAAEIEQLIFFPCLGNV